MNRSLPSLVSFCCFLSLACCQRGAIKEKSEKPSFNVIPFVKTVQPSINEASGIADSKKNPGLLWVQEDGGNPSQLYLLKHNGFVEKKIVLADATNRDWEDLVLMENELYLGDIGDNNQSSTEYTIYKFLEPAINTDTVHSLFKIRYRYADGPHDAEAFLVDPADKSIYLITKSDNPSRIYKLSSPFNNTAIHVAKQVGQLSFSGVVGATISSDRKEIIIKTYLALGYFRLSEGEKIESALSKAPISLPYVTEPQGEAVCFSADDGGYFTLSEKGFANDVQLYFYKRK